MEVSRNLRWAAVALISLVGLIHLVEAPEYFVEQGALWGPAFLANAAGSAVAAVGISRGVKSWGWTLGALIAGVTFVGYLISRSVGLPGLSGVTFLEPIGLASLLTAGIFLALYVKASTARSAAPARDPLA